MEPFPVNQTRWSDLIKQLAVTKGLDHVQVLADLVGAIVLENDRPEHKYLAGEALAWGQLLLAAQGAGIVGFVGVRNPAGSGKIVIVEQILPVSPASTRQFYIAIARAAVLTLANTEQPRDTRLQPTGAFGTAAPGIAGQIVSGRSDTITVTPFVVAEVYAGLNTGATLAIMFQFPWLKEVVLAPGDAVLLSLSDRVGGQLANESLEASFCWRERTLEPTET